MCSREYGVDVTFVGGDLSKPDDVKDLYRGALEKFPGGIDILVNNAGESLLCSHKHRHARIFFQSLTCVLLK